MSIPEWPRRTMKKKSLPFIAIPTLRPVEKKMEMFLKWADRPTDRASATSLCLPDGPEQFDPWTRK